MKQMLREWCRLENKNSGGRKVSIAGCLLMSLTIFWVVVKDNLDQLDRALAVVFVFSSLVLICRFQPITPEKFSPRSYVPDSFLGFIAESSSVQDDFKEAVAAAISSGGDVTFERLQEIWDKFYPPEPPRQEGREKLMKFLR